MLFTNLCVMCPQSIRHNEWQNWHGYQHHIKGFYTIFVKGLELCYCYVATEQAAVLFFYILFQVES